MMKTSAVFTMKLICIIVIILAFSTPTALSVAPGCEAEEEDSCNNKKKALPLKLIAIFSILITSVIGVGSPLVTRSIPALSPDRNLFVLVKAFASGIILATGFMHVLPDSFEMLGSSCLEGVGPWHKFPFSGFLAMLSAILTLMVDSFATSMYTKNNAKTVALANDGNVDQENPRDEQHVESVIPHSHHHPGTIKTSGVTGSQLLRYRVVAMVLELGIIVHSVVIGLSLGASNNTCTIKGLVAALCFHQMFEGMGLGGCILQADYGLMKKTLMAFFFTVTTPFGIAVGMGLSSSYKENSPTALVTVGLLNASSAGLLVYMALVDLLAADFMGPKLQGNIKLQMQSYVAVLLGAGGMSLMAVWA